MSEIVKEIQAVVDRLHQEGHTIATRLENALHDLKAHFKKSKAEVVTEVEADAKKVAEDAAPVVAEVEADVVKVKGEVEKNLAEAEDLLKAKPGLIIKP